MTDVLLETLKKYFIRFDDMRRPEYDNDVNTLQLTSTQWVFYYVPGNVHSLNIVLNDFKNCHLDAALLIFNIIQEMYVFFSSMECLIGTYK